MEGPVLQKFEIYHPLTTPTLTLDWLNTFSVKQLQELDPNLSYEQVVELTQKKLQKVMSNQSLIYGIKHHEQADFLGEAGLLDYSRGENTMEFFQHVLPSENREQIIDEILTYFIKFAFEELKLDYLTANCAPNEEFECQVLEKHGFQKTIQTNSSTYFRLYPTKTEDQKWCHITASAGIQLLS